MYPLLHELLADRGGEVLFTCFGRWHLGYLVLIFSAIGLAARRFSRMDSKKLQRRLDCWSGIAFGMYLLDFFLMPLAYGYIDVEKLPFHVCTAMCVMCFLSNRNPKLTRYRGAFALLGFLSNFVYLIYPAGLMWHRVHPLSYRAVQTLLFHGVMTGGTLLFLLFGQTIPDTRDILRVTAGMTLWALAGNILYGGFAPEMNWFFLVRDPFYLLPETAAPFVMPFVNVGLFFAVQLALRGLLRKFRAGKDSVKGA